MTHTLIVMMKGNSVIVQPNRKSQGSIYIPRHLCSRSHSWFLFWNIRVSVTLTLQHDPSCLHSTCKPTWVSQEKEKFPAPSLSCSSPCLVKASIPSGLLLFPSTIHWNLPPPPFCGGCEVGLALDLSCSACCHSLFLLFWLSVFKQANLLKTSPSHEQLLYK